MCSPYAMLRHPQTRCYFSTSLSFAFNVIILCLFILLYSMNLGPSCNSKSSLFLATQRSRTVIIHLITLGRRIQLGTVHYLRLLSREIKTSDVLHFYHQAPVTFWCYECEFSFSKPKTNLCQHDYCHLSLQHFKLILVSYESGQFQVLFFLRISSALIGRQIFFQAKIYFSNL